MIGTVNWLSVFFQIRNLEARKNSLSMALETAKQKEKKDSVIETELKLGEVELKLSQLRRSKTQVTEGSCLFYTVEIRLALQETDCWHLLYNSTCCTVPLAVQSHLLYSPTLYNSTCCTVTLAVQFHLLYNSTCCTVPPAVQFRLLYSSTCCTVPLAVQFHLLYNSTTISYPQQCSGSKAAPNMVVL
jgi:hypothetical protein